MARVEEYRARLRGLAEWEPYLLRECGLPGPRGNLELAQAAAEEGGRELFERYAQLDAEQAPVNSPREFLAFCGIVGLGRLLGEPKRVRAVLSLLDRVTASLRRSRDRRGADFLTLRQALGYC